MLRFRMRGVGIGHSPMCDEKTSFPPLRVRSKPTAAAG